jgi:CheY-like chemotaxis protein
MAERTIIIADDDADIRETLAGILREEGYKTRTAENGREVLLALNDLRGAPCVLVLDLMMPVMSGFDLLQELAHGHRLAEIPVIVCTAAIPEASLPTGIRRFVFKPISLDVLLAGIAEACTERARCSVA